MSPNVSLPEQSVPPYTIETWPVGKLKKYERNARLHSPKQVEQLRDSFRKFGQVWPILVREDATIIAGHGRIEAARAEGLTEVRVIVAAGWTEDQCRAFGVLDNKVALNSTWDEALLASELADLGGMGVELGMLGFDPTELAALSGAGQEGLTDPDEAPEPPVNPVARVGDVWSLGRHRLLCGDCSDAAAVKIALNGAVPDLVVYDPPYEIDDAWNWLWPAERALVFADYRRARQAITAVAGYEIVYEFIWDGCTSWYTPNRPLARHKSCFYAAHEDGWDFDAARYVDGKEREAKTVHNTRGTLEYKPLPGGAVHLQTIFQSPNTKVDGAHAHAKPSQWVGALLAGARAAVVLDQFVGSGTSFVAAPAHTTVFGLEIDPAFCDVAVERWQNFTGESAHRA